MTLGAATVIKIIAKAVTLLSISNISHNTIPLNANTKIATILKNIGIFIPYRIF